MSPTTSWPVVILLTARRLFGVGFFSEWVGQLLMYWGALQYKALPCCARFCRALPRESKNVADEDGTDARPHKCISIRVVKVLSADVQAGVACELKVLDDFAAEGDDSRFHCLSYTWGDPFGEIERAEYDKPSFLHRQRRALQLGNVVEGFWSSGLARTTFTSWPWIAALRTLRSAFVENLGLSPLYDLFRRLMSYIAPKGFYYLIINNSLLPVGTNLYSALLHLSHTGDKELQAIWIDAVCINQGPEALETERATQVQAMHEIYTAADSVSIWVGAEIPLSVVKPAMDGDFTRHIQDAALKLHEFFASEPGLRDKFWTFQEASSREVLSVDQWRCYQEMLSAQTITVTCGRHKLSWDDVAVVSKAYVQFGASTLASHSQAGKPISEDVGAPHHIAVGRDIFRQDRAGLRKMFGPYVLYLNRNDFRCQDGRDMLYAHMGVCRYDKLTVSYDKPVSQVYTEFWSEILTRTPVAPLGMLTFIEDRTQSRHRGVKEMWKRSGKNNNPRVVNWGEASLPSWVPDLHVPLEPKSLTKYYSEQAFAAAGRLQFEPELCKVEIKLLTNELSLRGWRLDVVKEVSETTADFHPPPALKAVPRLLSILHNHITAEQSPYRHSGHPGLNTKLDALLATMEAMFEVPDEDVNWPLMNPRETTHLTHDWLLHRFASWMEQDEAAEAAEAANSLFAPLDRIHHSSVGADSTYIEDRHRLARIIPTASQIKSYAAQRARFFTSGATTDTSLADPGVFVGLRASTFGHTSLQHRRIFLTTLGWLGKGPRSVAPGDEVWIFAGSRIPLVLRPVGTTVRGKGKGTAEGGKHEFVGHAYVHGAMNGEVMERLMGEGTRDVVLI